MEWFTKNCNGWNWKPTFYSNWSRSRRKKTGAGKKQTGNLCNTAGYNPLPDPSANLLDFDLWSLVAPVQNHHWPDSTLRQDGEEMGSISRILYKFDKQQSRNLTIANIGPQKKTIRVRDMSAKFWCKKKLRLFWHFLSKLYEQDTIP